MATLTSVEKALEYKNKYGVDGIMIGRAAIGYPWFFNEVKHYFAKTGEHSLRKTNNRKTVVEAARNHLASGQWTGKGEWT